MTSVITSARRGTASVFDVVTNSAAAANQLIGTAVYAIDALDLKAQTMHAQVKLDCVTARVELEDIGIANAATAYVDKLEEITKRNFPQTPFDRSSAFKAAVERITAAYQA